MSPAPVPTSLSAIFQRLLAVVMDTGRSSMRTAQLMRVSTAASMQPTMQPTQAKRAGTSRHADVS
jgi:hypothetical protein